MGRQAYKPMSVGELQLVGGLQGNRSTPPPPPVGLTFVSGHCPLCVYMSMYILDMPLLGMRSPHTLFPSPCRSERL